MVFEGDEWKYAKQKAPLPRTRAEEQSFIDTLYANTGIDRDEWHRRTEALSNPEIWTAKGKTK